MKHMLRFQIVFSLLLTLHVPLSAGAQIWHVSTCVGAYCSPPPQNFNGDSPLYSTGNTHLDQARWDAYRYEMNEEYQEAVKDLEVALHQWAEDKKQAENMSVEQFEAVKTQALEQLKASLPSPPQNLPTLQERRELNPYPAGAKAELDGKLDKVWDQIKASSPLDIAKTLQQELQEYAVSGDSLTAQAFQKRGEFLRKELVLSKVIDSQGLLNFPNVEKPGITLNTPLASELGDRLRGDLNRSFANQSLVQAKCAQPGSDASLCGQLNDFHQATTVGLYAMDRWGQQLQRQGGVTNEFNYLLKALESQIAFAEGFYQGGAETLEGIKTMILNPKATLNAIGTAIWNYDKTYQALEAAVVQTWQDFKAADKAGKSFIIGKVGFEVASAFVPVSKVGWVEKVTKSSSIVARATQEAAQVLRLTQQVGVKNISEVRSVIRLNRELFSGGLASADDIAMSLNKMTRNNFEAYTKVVSEIGDDMTPGARNYLSKHVAYQHRMDLTDPLNAGDLKNQTLSYLSLEKTFDDIVGIDVDEIVHRGVRLEHGPTQKTLFDIHEKSLMANNRYNAPGDSALYTTAGDLETVKKIMAEELRAPVDEVMFGSQYVKTTNVLDLTDSGVLSKLKMTSGDLLEQIEDTKKAYELTQQLGHIAKNKKFNGIKAPSAKGDAVNVIIFK